MRVILIAIECLNYADLKNYHTPNIDSMEVGPCPAYSHGTTTRTAVAGLLGGILPNCMVKDCSHTKVSWTSPFFLTDLQKKTNLFIACPNGWILELLRPFMPDWLWKKNLEWHCYDEDTEILTRDGWKKFGDLKPDEEVATLSKDGYLQWQEPNRIYRHRYTGKMFHFKGKTHDILVTPNHRMLYLTPKGSQKVISAEELFAKTYPHFQVGCEWEGTDKDSFELPITEMLEEKERRKKLYSEAKNLAAQGAETREIYKTLNLPRGTVYGWLQEGKKPDEEPRYGKRMDGIPIDLWLKFLGWYLSEGCIDRQRSIKISQVTNKEYRDEIQEILGDMSLNVTRDPNSLIVYSGQLAKYLEQFGSHKEKYIPSWVKELPPYRLRVLLESLLKGDGCLRKSGYVFYTTSKRLADDVQEVAIKCGLRALISTDSRKPNVTYRVNIKERKDTWEKKGKKETINYDGYVYCVSVPNSIILVRRNGKAVWCGNSQHAQQPSKMALDEFERANYDNYFFYLHVMEDHPPFYCPDFANVKDKLHPQERRKRAVEWTDQEIIGRVLKYNCEQLVVVGDHALEHNVPRLRTEIDPDSAEASLAREVRGMQDVSELPIGHSLRTFIASNGLKNLQ